MMYVWNQVKPFIFHYNLDGLSVMIGNNLFQQSSKLFFLGLWVWIYLSENQVEIHRAMSFIYFNCGWILLGKKN